MEGSRSPRAGRGGRVGSGDLLKQGWRAFFDTEKKKKGETWNKRRIKRANSEHWEKRKDPGEKVV